MRTAGSNRLRGELRAVSFAPGSPSLDWIWCLRCLLLVMCTHPFAKKSLTLHLARSEGHERVVSKNTNVPKDQGAGTFRMRGV